MQIRLELLEGRNIGLPTITYQQGFRTNCDDTTSWTENLTNMLDADASLTVLYGDVFQLMGKPDSADDESVFYQYDFTDIPADTYNFIVFRWKTSVASGGMGARVSLYFDDATEQFILGESAPQYDIAWHVTTGTPTPGKTISTVRLWLDDYPDTVGAGTFYAYFEFLLISKNFTFQNFKTLEPHFQKVYAHLHPPGREGEISQYLGSLSPTIKITGDMMSGESWGSPMGEVMYKLFHPDQGAYTTEPWQYFTSDLINCKVAPLDFYPSQEADSEGMQLKWNLILKLHSLGALDDVYDILQAIGK